VKPAPPAPHRLTGLPPRLVTRLVDRLFGRAIAHRVDLAVRALDDARDVIISGQRALERDRFTFDREDVFREALEAWRTNPLARRIVSLTTQYVVGAGLNLQSKHSPTHDFLQAWWRHRLNRMAIRAGEWCDELSRVGNLVVLISTDAAGMSYVRALPATQIEEIVTRTNDVEQPALIVEKLQINDGQQRAWPAYDEAADQPNPDGTWPTVALHYAINRPVAAVWGESDLAPLLRWLARYSNWLEDRARLNRFRQTFVFIVRGLFASKAERLARQNEINANPPNPGSILVTDAATESWGVLHPQLDSFEASEDGTALKKMLAAGSGNPMHFLAEPESSTRTTAEAAGGPTFRHYEQRQNFFLWLIGDVAHVVRARRALVDASIAAGLQEPIKVTGADISARDNQTLGAAAAAVASAFADLRGRQLIDDAELLRVVYKFASELIDVEDMLARGRRAGPPAHIPTPGAGLRAPSPGTTQEPPP
jgi:hypothetical protein